MSTLLRSVAHADYLRRMIHYAVDGTTATITIDDPDRRNALTNVAMAELRSHIDEAGRDDAIAVVVVTGGGDRVFSAGGDLSGGFVDAPLADHAARGALAELVRTMRRTPKPVVGRVNGHALGGGLGVVAACDLAIAAEHAVFGTPEIDVGLWPMMITAALRPLVPRRALLEMMLTGRRVDAGEAARLGIINTAVPVDDLDATVDETVGVLASRSRAVLAMGKSAFYAVEDMDLDTALDHLHIGLTAIATNEDAAEGVKAFLERRDPRWKGR